MVLVAKTILKIYGYSQLVRPERMFARTQNCVWCRHKICTPTNTNEFAFTSVDRKVRFLKSFPIQKRDKKTIRLIGRKKGDKIQTFNSYFRKYSTSKPDSSDVFISGIFHWSITPTFDAKHKCICNHWVVLFNYTNKTNPLFECTTNTQL